MEDGSYQAAVYPYNIHYKDNGIWQDINYVNNSGLESYWTYHSQDVGRAGAGHVNYNDEDRTVHDFKSESGVYKEQSGLDLMLTKNSDTTYTITDKKSSKLNFTSGGYLSTIIDSNGNKVTLEYSGGVLKAIVDGSVRRFTLDVLDNGYLVGIIDPGGRRTSFSYTGIQLTKITYPDGQTTKEEKIYITFTTGEMH